MTHKTTDGSFSQRLEDHAHLYQFCDDVTWANRNPIPTPSGVPKVELASIEGYSWDLGAKAVDTQADVQQGALEVIKKITDRFWDQTLAISTFDEFCILTWLVKRNQKQFLSSDVSSTGGVSCFAPHGIHCPLYGEDSKSSPECVCWPAVVNRDRWKYLYSAADRCMLVIDNRFIKMLSTDSQCPFIKPDVKQALRACNQHWSRVYPNPDELGNFLEKLFNLVLRWTRCYRLFDKYPVKGLFKNDNFMVWYNWITQSQYLSVMEVFSGQRNGGQTHGQVSHFGDAMKAVQAYNDALNPGTLPNFVPRGQLRKQEMQPVHASFGAPGPAFGGRGMGFGAFSGPPCGGPGMGFDPCAGPAYGRPSMGFGYHHGAAWHAPAGCVSMAGSVPFGAAGPAFLPGGSGSPAAISMGGSAPLPKRVISLQESLQRQQKTEKFLETEEGKRALRDYKLLEKKQNFSCPSCQSKPDKDCDQCKSRYLTYDLVTYQNTTTGVKKVTESSFSNLGNKDTGKQLLDPPVSPTKRYKADSDQGQPAGAKKSRVDAEKSGKPRKDQSKDKASGSARKARPGKKAGGSPLVGTEYGKPQDCLCKKYCVCRMYQEKLVTYHQKKCIEQRRECICDQICYCAKGERCICEYHVSTGGKVSEPTAAKFFNPPNPIPDPTESSSDSEAPSIDCLDDSLDGEEDWFNATITEDLNADQAAASSAPASSAVDPPKRAPASSAVDSTEQSASSMECNCEFFCFCVHVCVGFNPGDSCRCKPKCTCALPREQGGKS